jgi:lysozyme
MRDEGLRLQAYKDSVGLWTIGVGHLLGPTQRMTEITTAEAFALLEADVAEAAYRVKGLVGTLELDAVRLRALTNMAFNLGNRLGEFKHFLAAVKAGDWQAAGQNMADSLWARQVGARAVRLRVMIETGQA